MSRINSNMSAYLHTYEAYRITKGTKVKDAEGKEVLFMKNYYKKSRIIIGILAVLISLIALINEDISMKVIVTLFIFGIAFGTSCLTVPISEKMIKVGDAVKNKILRVLFCCAVLPLTLLLAYILHMLILAIFDRSSGSINAAVITVFLYIATTVIVIVPYIQTIIVLICRATMRKLLVID